MPPLGIWLRIRGYLVNAASQINDYPARRALTSRQWADHASYYGQASDSAITFDSVYMLSHPLWQIYVGFVNRGWQFKIGLWLLPTQRLL